MSKLCALIILDTFRFLELQKIFTHVSFVQMWYYKTLSTPSEISIQKWIHLAELRQLIFHAVESQDGKTISMKMNVTCARTCTEFDTS